MYALKWRGGLVLASASGFFFFHRGLAFSAPARAVDLGKLQIRTLREGSLSTPLRKRQGKFQHTLHTDQDGLGGPPSGRGVLPAALDGVHGIRESTWWSGRCHTPGWTVGLDNGPS